MTDVAGSRHEVAPPGPTSTSAGELAHGNADERIGGAGASRRTDASPARSRVVPRLPLRITLVAMILGLVAIALTLTGFLTSALLEGYVRGQQDQQLRDTLAGYDDVPWFRDRCEPGGRGPGFPASAPSTWPACRLTAPGPS